jgi:hypothetical protein
MVVGSVRFISSFEMLSVFNIKSLNMKEVNQQNDQLQQMTETWIKPEITVIAVTEVTQGLGGGGTDFGSEMS